MTTWRWDDWVFFVLTVADRQANSQVFIIAETYMRVKYRLFIAKQLNSGFERHLLHQSSRESFSLLVGRLAKTRLVPADWIGNGRFQPALK